MKNVSFTGRNDITQQNFLKFMHDIHSDDRVPFGFSSKGTIVLTDDFQLFETLCKQEADNGREIHILQDFGLGKGELNASTSLNEKWRYSIYFIQQPVMDIATDNMMGGAHLLILADCAENLNNFTQTIIDYHVASNKIDMDRRNQNPLQFIIDPTPRLIFEITILNKYSNVDFDYYCFPKHDYISYLDHKGDLLNGKSRIQETIDKLVSEINLKL